MAKHQAYTFPQLCSTCEDCVPEQAQASPCIVGTSSYYTTNAAHQLDAKVWEQHMATWTRRSVPGWRGSAISFRALEASTRRPGVVVLHGGMKSSQDMMALARELASDFDVYVVDRRGRGPSAAHEAGFSVDAEVEDIGAVIVATGARFAFGLSSGALVTLRTAARSTPTLQRIALYEPPFDIEGSVPLKFVGQFEAELAQGKRAKALITALKGMQVEPLFTWLPRIVLEPILSLIMRLQSEGDADDVPIRALVPTLRYDFQIIDEMRDSLQDYTALQCKVLLLGGTKSPAFLRAALDALQAALPNVERVTLDGLRHDGPEDDGSPKLVAVQLRRFFGAQSVVLS